MTPRDRVVLAVGATLILAAVVVWMLMLTIEAGR